VRYVTGTLPTDITFTGQRSNLDQIGLYYFKARFYASSLGRFVSADTIVPRASDPQQLNRYAYGLNNPVKYIDPSGHAAICGTTAEGCERSWFQPNTQPHPPEAANNAWNLATGLVVAVASIPFELVDYVATGVQCVTSGCTAAEVALTLIPGAIGPLARQVDNVLDVARAAENAGDAVKAVENASDVGQSGSDLVKQVSSGQSLVDDVVQNEFKNVELSHPPKYSADLPSRYYGMARKNEWTKIGEPAIRAGRRETVVTIAHEEMHHRLWSRGWLQSENYVEKVGQRFANMKGLIE
jgi:RHS repeat-associated protein